MLFAMMIAGLVLSTSIPKAFDARGLAFGLAFAAMQVGRSAFTAHSIPKSEPAMRMNLLRITLWLACSGMFWIAGGLAEGGMRLALWMVAVGIEYSGPAMRFRFPGLGASSLEDWTVEGGHMAERCALFIIIALGESIVVTGTTFAEIAWTPATIAGFLLALLGSIAMWWVYFHIGAEAGSEQISHSDQTGRLARLAYTYLHLPIVAGIVVSAAGDELLLSHPDGHSDIKAVLCIAGGPLLFLVGTILFKRSVRGSLQLSHLIGIGLLAILMPFAHHLSPLALSAAATAIMLIVAAWEAISLGSGARSEDVEI
jgi:low temperature requirement protein LtrA